MNPLRVYSMGVNRLVCEAVKALLRREGIELVGMETDSVRAPAHVRALKADIVLIESHGKNNARILSGLRRLASTQRISFVDAELRIYHQEQGGP